MSPDLSPTTATAILGTPTVDRHAIKAALHRRGVTLMQLSEAAGLHPSACGIALARPFPAAEAAIARALGVAPAALWPERYPAEKTSTPASSKPSRKSRRHAGHPAPGRRRRSSPNRVGV